MGEPEMSLPCKVATLDQRTHKCKPVFCNVSLLNLSGQFILVFFLSFFSLSGLSAESSNAPSVYIPDFFRLAQRHYDLVGSGFKPP